MSHANARFTPAGRLLIVQRIEAGMPQAHVAAQMGVSRGTVAKWWHRWCEHGEAGLMDRSSRPHCSPRRTDAKVEERICRLRRSTRRGPVYLSARTGVPASTVWRILKRNGLNRLSWIDRPTGQVIRRYERAAPGELVHLDIKKVGQIHPGGGWRIHGRGNQKTKRPKRCVGYTHLHVAIDDYSRVAYVEAHDNETAAPWWGSGKEPRTGSGPTTWPSTRSSPTTARTSTLTRSRTCWPSAPSCTCAPARTGPRPTAKQNASTAPSPTNFSTPNGSDPKTNAASASNAGSTTTTVTDTTPQ